jgi:hypothetical protein
MNAFHDEHLERPAYAQSFLQRFDRVRGPASLHSIPECFRGVVGQGNGQGCYLVAQKQ